MKSRTHMGSCTNHTRPKSTALLPGFARWKIDPPLSTAVARAPASAWLECLRSRRQLARLFNHLRLGVQCMLSCWLPPEETKGGELIGQLTKKGWTWIKSSFMLLLDSISQLNYGRAKIIDHPDASGDIFPLYFISMLIRVRTVTLPTILFMQDNYSW